MSNMHYTPVNNAALTGLKTFVAADVGSEIFGIAGKQTGVSGLNAFHNIFVINASITKEYNAVITIVS